MTINLLASAALVLFGSFGLVLFLIPKIRSIVHIRKLIDTPDHRSSHKTAIPTMAGVSFFLTLIFALIFISNWDSETVGIYLIGSLTIIFAMGLKDDLMLCTPKAKIGAEILAILFVIFNSGLQIHSLEGFMGIYEIPTYVSYSLITIMILTIINAYNLIDGIDGLASIIGIVIFSVYGIIFYLASLPFYFMFCLCLIGIQLAYLRFNLSTTKKIFMGDTGSLVMGFCIGFLTLKFLAMDVSLITKFAINPENKFFVIAAILFIPLFDTFRVIGVRLMNNKSPFFPDNNHIHHILINSGIPHFKASLFLGVLSITLTVIFISLSTYLNSYHMLVVLVVISSVLLGLFSKLKINVETENRFRYLIRAIHFLF